MAIRLGMALVFVPLLAYSAFSFYQGHYSGQSAIARPVPHPTRGSVAELSVDSATYGGNCGAPQGNATHEVILSCNGKEHCKYSIEVNRLGDPIARCAKDFSVSYVCLPETAIFHKSVPAEAGFGSIVDLNCGPRLAESQISDAKAEAANDATNFSKPDGSTATQSESMGSETSPNVTAGGVVATRLDIHSATYGGNCGAPPGNVTRDVESNCGGKSACKYSVDVGRLGDPASKCGKDFTVLYSCVQGGPELRTELPPEAGFGSIADLNCEPLQSESRNSEVKASPKTANISLSGLNIRSATYGGNCGAPRGNATRDVALNCSGKLECKYSVDVQRLGDPVSKCGKDFSVLYSCGINGAELRTEIPPEAGFGSIAELSCGLPQGQSQNGDARAESSAEATPSSSGLSIRWATYGGNCGAPQGNVTRDVVSNCGGRMECTYSVDVQRLGDPVPKCGKDFSVSYSCGINGAQFHREIPPEAGFGSVAELSCASEPTQPKKK